MTERLKLELSIAGAHKVLTNTEIHKTIAEDGSELIMPDDCLYLCGYAPELIGCFILHKQNGVTWECHVQVLPEHRDKSEEFGQRVIEWAWANTDAHKLVAQIPYIYPNVKDFALRMGFEIEGTNRKSYRKSGEIHDQWYLGIVDGIY